LEHSEIRSVGEEDFPAEMKKLDS
jgi:hypothetical protein